MRAALAAALLAAAAPSLRAQAPPPAETVDTGDPTITEVRRRIKEEPAFAQAVPERVDRSRLAQLVVPDAGSRDERIAKLKEWAANDPYSAAIIVMGLAQDDAGNTHLYEDNLWAQAHKEAVDNTKDNKASLGKLRDAARKSTTLKNTEDMSPDEKREIMRTLFEGGGDPTARVLNGMPKPGAGTPGGGASSNGGAAVGAAPPETVFSGYYDRLSAGNMRGYSPQLLALLSALNARRPPGAPALIETGKLDYATLSFPGYGMDYDVTNLESRARRDRVLALARLAGATVSGRDLQDPDLEAKLAAKIPAARLPPRLKRRAELAAKARAAVAAFSNAALASKDPARITRGLLLELGGRQREAARWITAAALEEELARLDGFDGFLTPELSAAIAAVPAPAQTRADYAARGRDLQARLAEAKADAQKAQDLLAADAWSSSVAEVDRLSGAERALRGALARQVPAFTRVPYRVGEAGTSAAGWRRVLDDLMVKWLPSSGYARAVTARRDRRDRYLSLFSRIAGGDLDGAATSLAGLEPTAG